MKCQDELRFVTWRDGLGMLRRGTDMTGENEAVLTPSKHLACVQAPDLTDVLARVIPLAHPGEGLKCQGELLSIAKRQNPWRRSRSESISIQKGDPRECRRVQSLSLINSTCRLWHAFIASIFFLSYYCASQVTSALWCFSDESSIRRLIPDHETAKAGRSW